MPSIVYGLIMRFHNIPQNEIKNREIATAKYESIKNDKFPGQPEFVYQIIYCIIHLRRKIDVEQNWTIFQNLVQEHHDYIITHLNERWLNSIIDTYVDHAIEPIKSQALILAMYLNQVYILISMGHITEQIPTHEIRYHPNIQWIDNGKFSHTFERMDQNIVIEPFRSIWERFKSSIEAPGSPWFQIARVGRRGFFRDTKNRTEIVQLFNNRSLRTIVVLGGVDVVFTNYLIENSYTSQAWIITNQFMTSAKQVELIKEPINEALGHFSPKSIDCVYVDVGDDLKNVCLYEWYCKIKRGGIMAGDYSNPTAKNCVDQFVLKTNQRLCVTEDDPMSWYLFI